jgi:hypothetical protein
MSITCCLAIPLLHATRLHDIYMRYLPVGILFALTTIRHSHSLHLRRHSLLLFAG